MKLDARGTIQWSRCYGGSGSESQVNIEATPDGNVEFAANTNSTDGDVGASKGLLDGWIVKVNSNTGDIIWKTHWGGSKNDEIDAFTVTPDGNYLLACFSSSYDGDTLGAGDIGVTTGQTFIAYSGPNGWVRYPGNQWGSTYRVTALMMGPNSSVYYVADTTNDQYSAHLASYSTATGQTIESTSAGSVINSIRWILGQDLIIAGSTKLTSYSYYGPYKSLHGGSDGFVANLSSLGTAPVWVKILGGTADDVLRDVRVTHEGNYLVSGGTKSSDRDVSGNHGDWDSWMLLLNPDREILWQRCFGGTGVEYPRNSVLQMTSGAYVLAGSPNSTNGDIVGNHGSYDVFVAKFGYPESRSDFNADGTPDLFLHHPDRGTFYQWFLDDAWVIGESAVDRKLKYNYWRAAGSADFNGDGKADILLQHPVNGTFYLWYMDGPVQLGSQPLNRKLIDKAWRATGSSFWNTGGWDLPGEEASGEASLSVSARTMTLSAAVEDEEVTEEAPTLRMAAAGEETEDSLPENSRPVEEGLPEIGVEAQEDQYKPEGEQEPQSSGGCNSTGTVPAGLLLVFLPILMLRKNR